MRDHTGLRPTRARETLGWEPKVQLADGLKETMAYFRKLFAV